MSQNNVDADNYNSAEEEVLETSDESVDDSDDSSDDVDWETRAKKAEELASNYKIRAEKAERNSKELKRSTVDTKEAPKAAAMSVQDYLALSKANIHEDDISEVEEWARFKGMSISQALKTSTVKSILSEKEEFRKTASASNTGAARRGQVKPSPESILTKARAGDVTEDVDALAQARFEEKKKRAQR